LQPIDGCLVDLTQSQVEEELAIEEENRLSDGGVALHETSASSFLVMGLEIEAWQYVHHI